MRERRVARKDSLAAGVAGVFIRAGNRMSGMRFTTVLAIAIAMPASTTYRSREILAANVAKLTPESLVLRRLSDSGRNQFCCSCWFVRGIEESLEEEIKSHMLRLHPLILLMCCATLSTNSHPRLGSFSSIHRILWCVELRPWI